jgi:hypothetical protein
MGIDYWYSIEVEQENGFTFRHTRDVPLFTEFNYFERFFPERNFHKTRTARAIGYPEDPYDAPENPDYIKGDARYETKLTVEELLTVPLDKWEFFNLTIFLLALQHWKKCHEYKTVRLVISTNNY